MLACADLKSFVLADYNSANAKMKPRPAPAVHSFLGIVACTHRIRSVEKWSTMDLQTLLQHSSERGLLLHIIENQHLILANQKSIMSTLADLQTTVTAEDTVIDSAVTLIQGLAAQVAAVAPNQAAIDALAADIKAKSDGLAAAVAANTPAPAPAS